MFPPTIKILAESENLIPGQISPAGKGLGLGIEIEKLVNSINYESQKTLVDLPGDKSQIAQPENVVKLNWEDLMEERRKVKEKQILQSLLHQGSKWLKLLGLIEIKEADDWYLKGQKVDKSIVEFNNENQEFYQFYKKKFNIDFKTINPCFESVASEQYSSVKLKQYVFSLNLLDQRKRK